MGAAEPIGEEELMKFYAFRNTEVVRGEPQLLNY